MTPKETILAKLRALNIAHTVFQHPPLMTMEQGREVERQMGAVAIKTLLLADRHQHFMALLPAERRLDLKALSHTLGCGHLSFAPAADISRLLRAYTGAVSALGLLFDEGREISLLIDRRVAGLGAVAMHPCANDCSVRLDFQDFLRLFLPALGLSYRLI